jgi:hypothetical protein
VIFGFQSGRDNSVVNARTREQKESTMTRRGKIARRPNPVLNENFDGWLVTKQNLSDPGQSKSIQAKSKKIIQAHFLEDRSGIGRG